MGRLSRGKYCDPRFSTSLHLHAGSAYEVRVSGHYQLRIQHDPSVYTRHYNACHFFYIGRACISASIRLKHVPFVKWIFKEGVSLGVIIWGLGALRGAGTFALSLTLFMNLLRNPQPLPLNQSDAKACSEFILKTKPSDYYDPFQDIYDWLKREVVPENRTNGQGGICSEIARRSRRMSKKTRRRLDARLKAKVALEALGNEATVADLAAKY